MDPLLTDPQHLSRPVPFASDYPWRRLRIRLLWAAVLGLIAGLLCVLAVLAFKAGEGVVSLMFLLMGGFMSAVVVLHTWRGGRIGVEIRGTDLIVSQHFTERRIPLESINRVYLGEESTTLHTTGGYAMIDNCYFSGPEAREAFLSALDEQIGSRH